MIEYVYLLPLINLSAFAVISAFGKRFPAKGAEIGIAVSGWSFLHSLFIFAMLIKGTLSLPHEAHIKWFSTGIFEITMGVYVDGLTISMLMLITMLSLLVQIYSLSYMRDDGRFNRYYAYLSLFSGAMLGLVMCDNMLVFFMCWELTGICSYLLISFRLERTQTAYAGRKSYMTAKLADLGFFAGILCLFANCGTFRIPQIINHANLGFLTPQTAGAAGLLLFIGAMGKSAQAPFFVWMHPAMEAPSPVSAFVHGAAMPAAGIYMIARLYPLYTLSPDIMQVMTWTGAVTAFMGAAIALVSFDIKRVIAFSAVSQLGCILLALGAGGLNAGIFHLIISGYLTALLFLAAGAVIHYAGTNDIRKLGGLRQKIPTAWWTFLFAALAVSGIPPFSGFFSKTETLKTALAQGYSLYIPALITSAFTSLYMARVFITTFHARSKNTAGYSTAAETPHTMAFPIIFLAMLSLVLGWTLSHNGLLNYYIDSGLQAPLRLTEYLKTAVSISVSAAFMGIGVYLYQIRPDIPEILREKMRTLRRIIESSFGFDAFFLKLAYISGRTAQILYKIDFEFFDRIFIDGWALIADRLSRFSAWLDDNAADKAVEALGTAVFALGKTARFAQTGFAQNYLLVIAIAVSLFAAAAFSM